MAAKDQLRRALQNVTPGRQLTKMPGPRILIEAPTEFYIQRDGRHVLTSAYDANSVANRLKATVPSVAATSNLDEYNLNEWDCIVTSIAPISLAQSQEPPQYRSDDPSTYYSWSQRYPPHMSVVCVVSSGGFDVLDALPPQGERASEPPSVAIIREPNKVGRHLREVDGLPERISAIVRSELLPVAQRRESHLYFRHYSDIEVVESDSSSLVLRPFLLGPDDVALAGSYERSDEASVWLLPADIPDIYPWITEALREWHLTHPDRYPAIPDWQTAEVWQTTAEAAISAERGELSATFQVEVERYERELQRLTAMGDEARRRAAQYERALLSDDGDSLSEAVACSLAELGFHVVDMDQHWPEGDRREDLRVLEDEDPQWVALVEVKGAKNGAKETEVQNFGRWAERFILEEQRAPDARWFVTNHQRGMDPSARQQPFGNKPAVVKTFSLLGGSVIDTRALFDLVRIVKSEPHLAANARDLLKSGVSVLVRVSVEDLRAGSADDR